MNYPVVVAWNGARKMGIYCRSVLQQKHGPVGLLYFSTSSASLNADSFFAAVIGHG